MRIAIVGLLVLMVVSPARAEHLVCLTTSAASIWPDGVGTFPIEIGSRTDYVFEGKTLVIKTVGAEAVPRLTCRKKGARIECKGDYHRVSYDRRTGKLTRVLDHPQMRFKVVQHLQCSQGKT